MVPSPAVMTESPQHKISPEQIQQVVDDPMSLDLLDDAQRLVPALPTQSFVHIAKMLRNEGRLDLIVPHATADQLTGIFDLDTWTQGRIDVARARTWLALIVESLATSERPRGDLVRTMYAMDPEMWTFASLAATAVAQLDPEDDALRQQILEDMSALITWESPDGLFVVGVPDHEMGRSSLAILAAVYDDSLDDGRRLLNSLKWAIASEIEEQLLLWRKGRLADMGFPEWEDAMRLFAPISRAAIIGDKAPEEVALATEDEPLPPEIWDRGGGWLRQVMAALTPVEHGRRTREFLLLINELIAAQRLEPGDAASQEKALEQAQATLNLSFEMLLSGSKHTDPVSFLAERVAAAGLRRLFRHGYGALAGLRKASQKLHSDGAISIDHVGSLLDRPWGPAVRHLSLWMPEIALGSKKNSGRPIRDMSDVARATALVAGAAALVRLCFDKKGYGIDAVWLTRCDEPERICLGDLVRTAVIRTELPADPSRGDLAFPLTPADLILARKTMLVGGALRPDLRANFVERCIAVGGPEGAEVLSSNLLTRLEVELGGMEFNENLPDLNQIGGMLTIQQVGVWLKIRSGN